jgi:hypothetical protein
MRHIEWYEAHRELLRKKEELAAAWRAARGAAAVLAAVEGEGQEAPRKGGAAAAGVSAAARPQQQQQQQQQPVDPKRARVQRQLRAWRLRRAAEAARAEAAERARQAQAREEERAAEQRKREAVKQRLERQRAARAALLLREKAAAAEAVPAAEAEEKGPNKIPAVVLERRALKAVKAAKARWEELRRREEARDPAQRGRRQRALLAGWRQEAAWRMEEEPEAVEQRYAEAARAAVTLKPDPHCARRHAGFEDSDFQEKGSAEQPKLQQPQSKAQRRPAPFMDLQFRDSARLRRPTVAWQTRAYSDEDLLALDRRRHAGAHFQARHPAFPQPTGAVVC